MSDKTDIEWTATVNADGSVTPGATWNPIKSRRKDTGKVGWHCERVSEACRNCYAAAMNHRNLPGCGTGLDYTRTSRDLVDIFLDEKTLLAPLKWKRPRKVFVCSMTDLFGEFVPFEMIRRVLLTPAQTPQHTYQFLTKRPDRMAEFFDWLRGKPFPEWPMANCWLGTTVENQEWADKRIPHLLKCPAAVRFLSVEPMLGPVDLMDIPDGDSFLDALSSNNAAVGWVIAGGESGRNARPMHPDWSRSLRDQCAAARVPFFFKQWGEFSPLDQIIDPGTRPTVRVDRAGRDLTGLYGLYDEEDAVMARVGKKSAGRLLDGVEHSEFPVPE